jgi:hypothetical protein
MAYPNFDPNTDFGQPVRVQRVVITPTATPEGRFLAGAVAQVNPATTTIAQLTATAYDIAGVVVPDQTFYWESSNPSLAAVDQSGNVTRTAPSSATQLYDSNGCENVTAAAGGGLGGIVTVSAVWLRQDGSKSGVHGDVNVFIQNHGQRIAGQCAQPVRLSALDNPPVTNQTSPLVDYNAPDGPTFDYTQNS